MLRVRVKMRSGACALSHQDADTGEGYQEFMGGGLLPEVESA
jgi:hypothetical protein